MGMTMVKVTYANALPPLSTIGSMYGSDGEFINAKGKSATWVDAGTNNLVQLEGKGLKFEDGHLIAGTITKVTFEDFEGADFAVMTGEISAKKFSHLGEEGVGGSIIRALSGDDKLYGSAKDDYIEGHNGNDLIKGGAGDDMLWSGRGNDILFGGAGDDFFFFKPAASLYKGDGHDVIKDFDADGSDGHQDYLAVNDKAFTIHAEGKNTVIEFEGGSFTLLGVKTSELSGDDFSFPIN